MIPVGHSDRHFHNIGFKGFYEFISLCKVQIYNSVITFNREIESCHLIWVVALWEGRECGREPTPVAMNNLFLKIPSINANQNLTSKTRYCAVRNPPLADKPLLEPSHFLSTTCIAFTASVLHSFGNVAYDASIAVICACEPFVMDCEPISVHPASSAQAPIKKYNYERPYYSSCNVFFIGF